MHLYGTKSEHFGAIAVACRTHAQTNPNAVMRGRPITIEDHQNSRMIADPLRLLDCCLETDGGAAVVITSAERARDLKHKPAYIMAGAFGATDRNTQTMVKFLEQPETGVHRDRARSCSPARASRTRISTSVSSMTTSPRWC